MLRHSAALVMLKRLAVGAVLLYPHCNLSPTLTDGDRSCTYMFEHERKSHYFTVGP